MNNTTTSSFLAAGDWHGETEWAQRTIRFAAKENISLIIQLGDFGLWPEPGGPKYVRKVNKACIDNNVQLIVVPGNHENYDRLDRLDISDDGWMVNPEWSNIRFAPRGHVWQLPNGMWVGALGGAGSIDRNLREPHKSWWQQETITQENVNTLVSNVAKAGLRKLDVLFTHECPAGIPRPEMTSGTKPIWVTPDVEANCNAQRVLLRQAMDATQPTTLYHGHWHQWFHDEIEGVSPSGDPYTVEIFGLTMNGMPEGHAVEVQWDRSSTETKIATTKRTV